MATKTTDKVRLHMTGPDTGAPTLDELVALFRKLTGREPTEQDLEEAKRVLENRS